MKYLLIVLLLAGTAWGGERTFYQCNHDNTTWAAGPGLGFEWMKKNCTGEIKEYLIDDTPIGCDCNPELIEAVKGVLPYLELENEEPRSLVWTDGLIPSTFTLPKRKSEELRNQADAVERRDAAIKRFREALERVK